MLKLLDLPAKTLQIIDAIFNGFDGALVVDDKGRIVIITDKYAELAGLDKEKVLGRYVLDVFPTSRMMEVVTTGKPIYADLWEVNGETVFVSRVPIVWKGRIVGAAAVSVFRYVDEAQRFAERMRSLDRELRYYKSQVRKLSGARYSFDAIVGTSQAISRAKARAQQIARTRAPVLIVGETGTGKELFAHAIHQESPRRDYPFIRVNCASIPENLSESELFGYEDGAFTGAKKGGKPGKFELAHGGTIFLDEINELPYPVQAKLLRVLQEGEIERVGGTEVNLIDVRVISATSSDLRELVRNKLFREDLFYRLNVFILKIPPLRERLEDIPLLLEHFISVCNYELGTSITDSDPRVVEELSRHSWPGNIREFKNVVERACLNARKGRLMLEHLPGSAAETLPATRIGEGDFNLQSYLDRAEKEIILKVLESVRWNRSKAASLLGIHRTSLHAKMKKHGILP